VVATPRAIAQSRFDHIHEKRIVDPEGSRQGEPGCGRLIDVERMPEMRHAALPRSGRHRTAGHGLAHGH